MTPDQLKSLRALVPSDGFSQDDVIALIDECERLRSIVVNAQAAVYSFAETVRSAVEEHKRRGQGGQQVSFHGDFANATPSVLFRLEWWVRHLSQFVVQSDKKAGTL